MSDVVTSRKYYKKDGVYYVEGRPRESIQLLGHHRPSNIPGKSVIVLLVSQEPNSATPPHTHNGAAVMGLALQGQVLCQMNDDAPFDVKAGEMWYEAPGCRHKRGENNTDQLAQFFAILIVDDEVVKDGYEGLVVIDDWVKDAAVEK